MEDDSILLKMLETETKPSNEAPINIDLNRPYEFTIITKVTVFGDGKRFVKSFFTDWRNIDKKKPKPKKQIKISLGEQEVY